jgi:hypothetical protein
MSEITKFPVTYSQRWKNRHGKSAVACEISNRWLRFSDAGETKSGHLVWLEVMTTSDDGREKKLCRLAVPKEEIEEALAAALE